MGSCFDAFDNGQGVRNTVSLAEVVHNKPGLSLSSSFLLERKAAWLQIDQSKAKSWSESGATNKDGLSQALS